jgi:hypothetical protein
MTVNRRHLDALHRRVATRLVNRDELGAVKARRRGCCPLAVPDNPEEM